MSAATQNQLFVDELKDIYDAETRIEESLGELASEVDDDDLRNAFEEHREETRTHIDRLEQVFNTIDVEPGDEECEATKGLVEEHDEFAGESPEQVELDLFDLTAAQKVEHYEIASYGNLAKMADELGMDEVGDLLHQTLEEEEETLDELKKIADNFDYSRLQR